MKLSTKARYAITAMMDLALHEQTRPVTLADISQNQGISLSYLEQLFARLRSYGLVRGVRGPGGGYRLAKASGEISIAEIVAAINDKNNMPQMAEPEGPDANELTDKAMMDLMWNELSCRIYNFLEGQTLDQFINLIQGARTEEVAEVIKPVAAGGPAVA